MPDSRSILTKFLELIEQDDALQTKVGVIKSRLQRLDLRKRSARIVLWNVLSDLKAIDSSAREAIDGLLADLAEKWQPTLGKALREKKILK
ncbi:MAG: hypothetical protein ACTSRS_11405 [Candidatus Helarchaeota archaeon]